MTSVHAEQGSGTDHIDDLYWRAASTPVVESDQELESIVRQAELPVLLVSLAAALDDPYVGIVVGLHDDDLAAALEGALKAIIADGTYEKVMKEWKLEALMLPEPGINLAASKPLEVPTPCGACGK